MLFPRLFTMQYKHRSKRSHTHEFALANHRQRAIFEMAEPGVLSATEGRIRDVLIARIVDEKSKCQRAKFVTYLTFRVGAAKRALFKIVTNDLCH